MEYRKHLQAFIDRWRYNANRAAQAQSKIKILEKAIAVTLSGLAAKFGQPTSAWPVSAPHLTAHKERPT